MARNRYPGYCYCCGKYVEPGFGHFERHNNHWRVKCVQCASGRIVHETDKEVQRVVKMNEETTKMSENIQRENIHGKIFTGKLDNKVSRVVVDHDIDEVWVIVRSYKQKLKDIACTPIIHVPELSPSSELFQIYLSLKEAGNWNVDTFKKQYVSRFLHEMLESSARHWLTQLVNAAQNGKRILLVCYCSEEALCHRSIVCGLLQGRGVTCGTITEDQINYDYSFYYKTYLDMWRKQGGQ